MKGYWDRRAEADMDRLQAQAGRRLNVIGKSVLEAQSYLTGEIEKILGQYQKRFGLTREEAIEELSKPVTRAEYDRLLIRLATMPEGDEKRLLEARINSGAYAYRISRAEALRDNIAIETAKVAQIAEEQAAAQFGYTGKEAYARKLFSIQQQTDQLFAVPDIDTFKVSSQSPWFGGDYSASIWKNRDALAEALEQKITAGYLSGRSNAKIAQDIQEQFGVSFRVAERLVRTETAYISGQSDLAAYKRSGVKWYRFVATLDTRTCDDCGPMDLTVYEVEKARVGENYPPMHPWCRCTTVAVWDKDRPMEGTRFARDAAGKAIQVPKGMTFEEWKKWQQAGAPADIEAWRTGANTGLNRGYTYGKLEIGQRVPLPGGENAAFDGWGRARAKVIAGYGVDREIDDIKRLIDQYGGSVKTWEKVKRTGYVIMDETGERGQVDFHWYQESKRGIVERKIKVDDDGEYFNPEA